MMLIYISSNALGLQTDTAVNENILLLLGIDLLLAGAALMLFPYLWRD